MIWAYVFLILLVCCEALRLKSKVSSRAMSTVRLPYSMDWSQMRPLPPASGVFDRYCHVDAEFTARLRSSASGFMEFGGAEEEEPMSEADLISGHCSEDADCGKGRPFCIDEVCRECREGYEFEDCDVKGAICKEETRYTCSSCVTDDDCPSRTYCRQVFSKTDALSTGKLPRNECVSCGAVPAFGEVIDVSECAWRCPIEQYYLSPGAGESSCLACPQCGLGQYYAPRESISTHFYTTCTNSTDVVCNDCEAIGIKSGDRKNFCANILSPSPRLADQISVGDLGEGFPCRFFECKENWFLSSAVNKCKQCHITMCAPGEYLEGCGGVNPGSCRPCKGRIPNSAEWILANSGDFSMTNARDACRFTCPPQHVFLDNDCIKCAPCSSDFQVYALEDDS